MTEKSFQNYFMKNVKHGKRTALVNGGGFPDCLLFHGKDRYSLVELKLLQIGPSGNKKIKGLFQKTQPPWYLKYLREGGDRLFVVFKLNYGYGLLHVCKPFIMDLSDMTYLQMKGETYYEEFDVLKKLLERLEE